MNGRPLVSVIVPVHGQATGLGACLDLIAAQTYPRDRMETIVVDNGCGPLLERALARHPGARRVREARPGSYAARNAGIAAARGEILAFTDEDCLPREDWVERGVESLGRASASGVSAGQIDVFPRPDRASPTAYVYESLFGFRQDQYVRDRRFGATANLFIRRAVIDAVGPFDATLFSSGDQEWGVRASERGFAPELCPAARVRHPSRTSRAILDKALRLAGGHEVLRRRREPAGHARATLHVLRFELRTMLGVLQHVFRRTKIPATMCVRVGVLVGAIHLLRIAERLRVLWGGKPRRT